MENDRATKGENSFTFYVCALWLIKSNLFTDRHEFVEEIIVLAVIGAVVFAVFMGFLHIICRLFFIKTTAEWISRGISGAVFGALLGAFLMAYYRGLVPTGLTTNKMGFLISSMKPFFVPSYLVMLNLFIVPLIYWIDKRRSMISDETLQRRRAVGKKAGVNVNLYRVPENSLHVLTAIGGGVGAVFAQKMFRHKTSKASFRRVFFFTLLVNIPFYYYLWNFINIWQGLNRVKDIINEECRGL